MSATVKGGLFETAGLATLSTIHTTSALKRMASWALGRKQTYGLREIMETLNGAAAGSAASKTLTRIEANSELGGLRVIETETLVSANTTAADVTDINADILSLSSKTYDPTPPANLDGNPLGTR